MPEALIEILPLRNFPLPDFPVLWKLSKMTQSSCIVSAQSLRNRCVFIRSRNSMLESYPTCQNDVARLNIPAMSRFPKMSKLLFYLFFPLVRKDAELMRSKKAIYSM